MKYNWMNEIMSDTELVLTVAKKREFFSYDNLEYRRAR